MKNYGKDVSEEDLLEFLKYAKTSINENEVLEQKFEGFHVAYDGYWTRYRVIGNSVRCQISEDVLDITELPECARNCWKLLMFRKRPEDIETSIKLLIPLLKNGEIKSLKHNGDSAIKTLKNEADYVIVFYTWGIEDRDRLKVKLHSIGFTNIPYRRGCKMFEISFGHWKQWFKK